MSLSPPATSPVQFQGKSKLKTFFKKEVKEVIERLKPKEDSFSKGFKKTKTPSSYGDFGPKKDGFQASDHSKLSSTVTTEQPQSASVKYEENIRGQVLPSQEKLSPGSLSRSSSVHEVVSNQMPGPFRYNQHSQASCESVNLIKKEHSVNSDAVPEHVKAADSSHKASESPLLTATTRDDLENENFSKSHDSPTKLTGSGMSHQLVVSIRKINSDPQLSAKALGKLPDRNFYNPVKNNAPIDGVSDSSSIKSVETQIPTQDNFKHSDSTPVLNSVADYQTKYKDPEMKAITADVSRHENNIDYNYRVNLPKAVNHYKKKIGMDLNAGLASSQLDFVKRAYGMESLRTKSLSTTTT